MKRFQPPASQIFTEKNGKMNHHVLSCLKVLSTLANMHMQRDAVQLPKTRTTQARHVPGTLRHRQLTADQQWKTEKMQANQRGTKRTKWQNRKMKHTFPYMSKWHPNLRVQLHRPTM
jgi:hypothetical protein